MIKEIGKYTIEKELGKGGMATVYLALHKDLGRQVALKIMHPHLACEEESRKRFELEAKAVAKLEHTNVVQIYDFGSQEDLFYIAMELVHGKDVEKWVKTNGALPSEIAAILVSGIAGGLALAHKHGIIHRDIKPANFIIKPDGIVKLSDFGIARMDGSASMTKSDSIVGTPYFIAPEQIDGAKASASSDIYALGVSLYYMVTGKFPYKSDTLPLVLASIAKGNFIPVKEALPSVPAEIAAIIEKTMYRQVEKRYSDAQQIVQDLHSFLYKRQVSADPSTVVSYMSDPSGFAKNIRETGIRARFERARNYSSKGMVLEAFQELESILQEDPSNSDVKEELERLSDLRLTKTRSKIDGATVIISRPGKGNSLGAKLVFAIIAILALIAIVIVVFTTNRDNHKYEAVNAAIPVQNTWRDSILVNKEDLTAHKPDTVQSFDTETKTVQKPGKKNSVAVQIEKEPEISVVPESLATVEKAVVSECKGELSIVSEYWGVAFLNGERSGNVPTKLPIEVTCGDYVLRVESPSGKIAETVINISGGTHFKARLRESDFK